jgi:hypothetical protein
MFSFRDSHEHRRCIAACVVNGTYATESDEYMNRMHTGEALAPAWWKSFSFRRLKTLFFRIRKSIAYHCIKKGKSSKYKEATGQRKEKKLKQPKEETHEQTKDSATLAWTLLSRH